MQHLELSAFRNASGNMITSLTARLYKSYRKIDNNEIEAQYLLIIWKIDRDISIANILLSM